MNYWSIRVNTDDRTLRISAHRACKGWLDLIQNTSPIQMALSLNPAEMGIAGESSGTHNQELFHGGNYLAMTSGTTSPESPTPRQLTANTRRALSSISSSTSTIYQHPIQFTASFKMVSQPARIKRIDTSTSLKPSLLSLKRIVEYS